MSDSLMATFHSYFADGRRLINLLWPVAPLLRAEDPGLGALFAAHCHDSITLMQLYDDGLVSDHEVQQAVTTFNALVDQLELHLGAMFDSLFAYADYLITTLMTADPVLANRIHDHIDTMRTTLTTPPAPSIEEIHTAYLRMDAIVAPVEYALRLTEEAHTRDAHLTPMVAMKEAS